MRRGLAAVAAALVAAAGLALAAPASAATYTVQTCANGSVSGWSHFNLGDWSTWGNGCGVAGAGLSASIEGGAYHTAGWRFGAPPDTEIAAFRVTRSYSLPANRPYGTGVYVLATAGSGRDYYNGDANFGGPVSAPPATEAASGLTGQTALTAHVDCGGGLACTGRAAVTVYDAWFDLRDDSAPAIVATSGTLLAGGPLRGARSLSYAATDRGGGLLRERLVVDGSAVLDRPVDANGGACDGPPFAAVVPCRLSASGTLELDTTRLAEGAHTVALDVWDATGVNRTRHGPFQIEVDNVPPPSSTSAPRIAGTAAAGATLVADDGAWTGSGLTLARRWERLDGGAWEAVPGATGVSYAVSGEDAGHRLRLRVRATNAEGTAEAHSEPTALVTAPAATPEAPRPLAEAPRPLAPAPVLVAPAPVLVTPAPEGAVITAAFESAGQSATTLRWGQRRLIAGSLRTLAGRPIAGAQIDVTTRAHMLAAVPVSRRPVTTDAEGRFTYILGPGVSRAIAFSSHGATAAVTARVLPHIVLRAAATAAVAGGDPQAAALAAAAAPRIVLLSGRVVGAPAGLRKRVELQALAGRAWRTFAATSLAPTGGGFRYRTRSAARRFRAVVRAEPGWPFLTGASAAATTRG